jgi:hypothetical protein
MVVLDVLYQSDIVFDDNSESPIQPHIVNPAPPDFKPHTPPHTLQFLC